MINFIKSLKKKYIIIGAVSLVTIIALTIVTCVFAAKGNYSEEVAVEPEPEETPVI